MEAAAMAAPFSLSLLTPLSSLTASPLPLLSPDMAATSMAGPPPLSLSRSRNPNQISLSLSHRPKGKKIQTPKIYGRQPWPPSPWPPPLSLSLVSSAQITLSISPPPPWPPLPSLLSPIKPPIFPNQANPNLSLSLQLELTVQKKEKKNKLSGVDPTATAAAPKMSRSSRRRHVRSSSATGISNIKRNQNFAAKAADVDDDEENDVIDKFRFGWNRNRWGPVEKKGGEPGVLLDSVGDSKEGVVREREREEEEG